MRQSEESSIEDELENYVNYLKRKTIVSLPDLDRIYELLERARDKIEKLRKGRDNWRSKYEELKNGK